MTFVIHLFMLLRTVPVLTIPELVSRLGKDEIVDSRSPSLWLLTVSSSSQSSSQSSAVSNEPWLGKGCEGSGRKLLDCGGV